MPAVTLGLTGIALAGIGFIFQSGEIATFGLVVTFAAMLLAYTLNNK